MGLRLRIQISEIDIVVPIVADIAAVEFKSPHAHSEQFFVFFFQPKNGFGIGKVEHRAVSVPPFPHGNRIVGISHEHIPFV